MHGHMKVKFCTLFNPIECICWWMWTGYSSQEWHYRKLLATKQQSNVQLNQHLENNLMGKIVYLLKHKKFFTVMKERIWNTHHITEHIL